MVQVCPSPANLRFGQESEGLARGDGMAHDALAMIVYPDSPPVCIFGDSEAALARMRRTAEAAGCRVAACAELGAADPAACVPTAAALIELDGAGDEAAAVALLDWAQHEAARGARRIVVSAPAAWIDLVAARTPDPRSGAALRRRRGRAHRRGRLRQPAAEAQAPRRRPRRGLGHPPAADRGRQPDRRDPLLAVGRGSRRDRHRQAGGRRRQGRARDRRRVRPLDHPRAADARPIFPRRPVRRPGLGHAARPDGGAARGESGWRSPACASPPRCRRRPP